MKKTSSGFQPTPTTSEHATSKNIPNVTVTTKAPVPVPVTTKTVKPAPLTTITIKPTLSTAPRFLHASLKCVVTDHESFPGEANIPLYQPELTWELKNATGMALSIDNPGLVGSYGSYDWHGTLILGAGCYTDEGTHTIVLYSTGGSQQVQVTIHEKGTMTRPTPPPFAYPTNLPLPSPSAS